MKLKDIITTQIKDHKKFIVPIDLPDKKSTVNLRVLQASRISSPITRHQKTESIEQVIMNLNDGLIKAGVDAYVAAPGDSKPFKDFNILPTIKKSYNLRYSLLGEAKKIPLIREHYLKVINYAIGNKFDIIHDHYKLIENVELDKILYCKEMPAILSTLHVPPEGVGDPNRIKLVSKKLFFSVVSDSQKKIFIEKLGIDPSRIYSVHNGIDLNDFTFQQKKHDYLLFIGRINQDKGVHTTCTLAKETGNTLVISGYFDSFDKIKNTYFIKKIKPYIDIILDLSYENIISYKRKLLRTVKENPGKIIYVGRSDPEQRSILYKNAKAYIFVSGKENEWIEPFGLVMIEANASGTPVIAFDNGAVKEIIQKNCNGIIAKDYKGLVQAIHNIALIKPHNCRAHIELYFTADIMARNYIKLYKKIIKRNKRERG